MALDRTSEDESRDVASAVWRKRACEMWSVWRKLRQGTLSNFYEAGVVRNHSECSLHHDKCVAILSTVACSRYVSWRPLSWYSGMLEGR
jgi:hypothetical protein